jgi:hypothetical protein
MSIHEKRKLKIVLNLTKEQHEKIQLWLNECINIYNITNKYIKRVM